MRIKIMAADDFEHPAVGPYKTRDIIERASPYVVGEMTHYGEVILIPPTGLFNDDAEQSIIVKLDPESLAVRPDESVYSKPPIFYNKIEFFPINVDTVGMLSDDPPPVGTHKIMDGITIEDVATLITDHTFSLWTTDCHVSRDTASALRHVRYALVHRYLSPTDRDLALDKRSTELVNMAVCCLLLVRPTRRSHALNIPGIIKGDGTFEPHGFSASHELAEVPEIQKLFTIRNQDIALLRDVLPEFIKLYQKDEHGNLKKDYEPLRMAIQLYEQGYALTYWKPRHILWWSAIEALYGSSEETAKARIYALFGDKDLLVGSKCSIYEEGDIPSCYSPSLESDHTLGEMVPIIYSVRNFSAHGQQVPDSYFSSVAHPFGQTIGIDALAEAASFIIRKTVVEILKRGWRDKFRDKKSRDNFWLYHFSLDKKQSVKRLAAVGLL
jgi:hypothetical protein